MPLSPGATSDAGIRVALSGTVASGAGDTPKLAANSGDTCAWAGPFALGVVSDMTPPHRLAFADLV